jgi:hypothetical protein
MPTGVFRTSVTVYFIFFISILHSRWSTLKLLKLFTFLFSCFLILSSCNKATNRSISSASNTISPSPTLSTTINHKPSSIPNYSWEIISQAPYIDDFTLDTAAISGSDYEPIEVNHKGIAYKDHFTLYVPFGYSGYDCGYIDTMILSNMEKRTYIYTIITRSLPSLYLGYYIDKKTPYEEIKIIEDNTIGENISAQYIIPKQNDGYFRYVFLDVTPDGVIIFVLMYHDENQLAGMKKDLIELKTDFTVDFSKVYHQEIE